MEQQALQIGGSLLAILAIVVLVHWFGVGRHEGIVDEQTARAAAAMMDDGFVPRNVAIDVHGKAALLASADGAIMLLRPHGTHYAARMLDHRTDSTIQNDELTIDTGERAFGTVHLTLGDRTQAWADAINRLSSPRA